MATIESARAKYEAAERRLAEFDAGLAAGRIAVSRPDLKRRALVIATQVLGRNLRHLERSHGVQFPLLALEEMTG